MTLPINEMGGLLASEIDLRINEATGRQGASLEKKLQQHQEVIERRLSVTDEAVKDNLNRTIELKTDVAVLMSTNSKQTELLETLNANGQTWHEADLIYRADMVKRVSAIEDEQKRLRNQVQLIRWLVATSAAVTRAIGLGVKLLCTETFWKIAGVSILLYLVGHFSPRLFHLLSHILVN